jgi:threonyl-tRNA synthetase
MRAIIARRRAVPPPRRGPGGGDRAFERKGEGFKVELIQDLPADQEISLYSQGEWVDLCRGPHMRSTGDVGNAFKLMKVAGAYWRGDHRNPVLSRIYGTAWRDAKELEAHLHQLEEAERRDHRRIGKEMHLFHIQEEAVGSVFWHPKGWKLYRTVEDYMRRRLDAAEYQEVRTPQLVDRKLWIESGHWEKFREHMFICTVEDEAEKDRVLALKPMNCPGHVQIFNQGIRSYRELPLRMAEFGSCHRYEPSGALHGIMRVRAFTQDDAHIFCTEGQIADETARFVALLSSIYRDLGFPEFRVKFSDRPPVRAGTDAVWDQAEGALREACAGGRRGVRAEPGGGRLLRPQAGVRAARRHRPRLAVRHPPGGLRPARAPRRRVHRRGRQPPPPGHAAPRDPGVLRALPRHPDRAACGTLPALARAGAGGGGDHRGRRRAPCAGGGCRHAARRPLRRP